MIIFPIFMRNFGQWIKLLSNAIHNPIVKNPLFVTK
jgi:hypothetical protein